MLGQPVSMLIPQVVGFRLDRRAAGGRDRHRPRPDRHADAARAARGQQVRRVLRPGAGEPAAGRPRDDRQHVAGVRRDVRDLPGRRRDAALPASSPAARPSRSSSSRPTAARRACSTSRASPEPVFSDTLELDLATVEPSLAGPRRPQDRVAAQRRGERLPRGAAHVRQRRGLPGLGHVRGADVPGQRPAVEQGRGRLAEAAARAPRRRRAGGPHARRRRRPRPRRGGDRRDHELHEHVEPVGHARRRAAGPQGGRGGPDAAAVGEDEPRARARRSSPSTSSARA